uniref:Uncharacterized protein n=1 Tax=Lactuca sativa TaxID=4236 RepID=A0A9R1XCF8_LACSA|nr:hypothetical protein LSAT_V11C400213090 [Lactuca sativa]
MQHFLLRFKDSHGGFMRFLETGVRGFLSLYEASYLSFEWERDLHEAKLFAREHLLKLKRQENEAHVDINHVLELPSYRRMLRLQASYDFVLIALDANMPLLELATLDYNMVQSEFKKERNIKVDGIVHIYEVHQDSEHTSRYEIELHASDLDRQHILSYLLEYPNQPLTNNQHDEVKSHIKERDIIYVMVEVYCSSLDMQKKNVSSLHAASLRFRLHRKHGYSVSQDFLLRFKDSHGGFMRCLETDVRGLLSLYEASYLSFECQRDLQEAKLYAREHLLKLKMLRLQARWYIDAYSKGKDANMLLLELATLDYNMVQSEFKKELQEVSKWWKNIGLASKLSFVRDRLMECFFWSVGVVFEPQYNSCRVELTKVCTLITVIDDIYDVYGSLDELVLFTDAVKRYAIFLMCKFDYSCLLTCIFQGEMLIMLITWDINAVKHMPEYLQPCFRTLYNTIIEIGCKTSITQGEDILPALVKVWGELLEAFLLEAKWTHNKYIPTLQEYMDNAWRSVSGVVILTHGYFLINQEFKKDIVEKMEKYNDLLKWSSIVFRLCNDLGTSSEMIKARVASSQESTDPFIDMAINLARISHCVYQYGDGHGAPVARAKERVLSVIIEPIPIKDN